jgi:hypothetical protein
VHSARLERWGEGLAGCSGESVAAHLVAVPAVEAYASGNSDAAPGSSIAASRIEDADPALTGKPCSGF